MEQAIGLGADGYIVKPFDSDKVSGFLPAWPGPKRTRTKARTRPCAAWASTRPACCSTWAACTASWRARAPTSAQLLAAGQPDAARAHLGRLAEGCRTLGLLDAAAALEAQAALASSAAHRAAPPRARGRLRRRPAPA
jgi:two-component system chemotaxis response regulator CheY